MAGKFLGATLITVLILGLGVAQAEERKKFEKLPMADGPCLFLLDEDTGEPTGNAVNPPCELGQVHVNPGDDVNPALRAQYGKASTESSASASPREKGSGMATGRR